MMARTMIDLFPIRWLLADVDWLSLAGHGTSSYSRVNG